MMIPTIDPPGSCDHPDHIPDRSQVQEFVIACLRHRLGTGSLPNISALMAEPGFDLQALINYAHAQRVAPLLHRVLGDDEQLPVEIAQNFEQAYRTTAQVNLFLLHEFHQVLQALVAEGLPVVVGKGALLVEQIYHNPALRPFSDLDVFIPRQAVPVAITCLRNIGFETVSEPYQGQALDFEKELMMLKSGITPVMVDLHWVLFGPTYYHLYRVPQDWLWEQTVPALVRGVQVAAWHLEIQLLHLASHLILDHAADRALLWWYDLAALIQTNQHTLQWDLILEYAQALRIILPVRECLHILKGAWGISIPTEILRQLQAALPSPEEASSYHLRTLPDHSHVHRAWEALRAMNSNRLRWRYIRMRLFPSPDYIYRILPVSKSPLLLYLAYWYRGFRMVFDLLRGCLMSRCFIRP